MAKFIVYDENGKKVEMEGNPPLTAREAKCEPIRKIPREKLGPVPDGPRDDHFSCVLCLNTHPLTEGKVHGRSRICIACERLATSVMDGTFRYLGRTAESLKRNSAKAAAKQYRAGKLPKWMLS